MEQDKMREEFHAWARSRCYCLRRCQFEPSGYAQEDTQIAWEVWQASREALAVELPKSRNYYGPSSECEEAYEPDEVVAAIHAAGIRTR